MVIDVFVGGNLFDLGGARLAETNAAGGAIEDVAVGGGRPVRVLQYLGNDFAGVGEPPATDLDVIGGAVPADGGYFG